MRRTSVFGIALLIMVWLMACTPVNSDKGLVFVTRPGLGLDKWASIWLVKRYIDADAKIQWINDDSDEVNGVLFDTDKSLYRRRARQSTFSSMVAGFNIQQQYMPELEQLIHDIEINYWGAPQLRYSNWVEGQFRQLQTEFGFEKTPIDCYLVFFDYIAQNIGQLPTLPSDAKFIPDKKCMEQQYESIAREKLIQEWPVATVLKALEQGKRIVFVDVRETEEFDEDHIPGAINIKIREIHHYDLNQLADADVVIPYCVKDFRGFEMARLLKRQGIKDVVLMRPYGLKGWVSSGLPIVNKKTDEQQVLQALFFCAKHPANCLLSGKSV